MPFLSCIVLSHNKAPFVGQAIGTLVAQAFPDWEAIVFDSGVLYDQGFFDQLPALRDRRIRLVRSWETDELRKTKTIASWCFNECFRKHLVRGEYVTYLCDDDLLYPNAFQAYHAYAQAHPGVMAMYASIDVVGENTRGEKCQFGELVAREVKGSCCGGGPLDRQVDYLQLCHKVEILRYFGNDEYWPEDREIIRHADGVFLEKIGSYVPIYPVDAKIGQNRKVPLSLNDGGEHLEALLRLHRLEEEKSGLLRALADLQAENNHLRQSLSDMQSRLRYRVIDKLNSAFKQLPFVHAAGKKLVVAGWHAWQRTSRTSGNHLGLQTEYPLRPSNSDLANPNLSANGGRLLATADGATATAPPASSRKPHLLFVTEKWCDGNPQAGLTNNEHNLFGSLDVAGLATHERLHLDEYRLQHGRNCDEELLRRCRTRRPTAIIACYLFCSTLNVSHDTWKQIHEMRIPVVFIWFDAVLKPRMQLADSLAPFAALSLVLDTAAYHTGFPDRYLPMWTPQDTRYFFNPHRARDIDVSFLGSMAGYADRQVGIAALRNCGIEVFQRGGQREQALPLRDYAGVLQRSKICLNFPRMRGDPMLVQAKGRIFEATLCGALLLDAENDQTRRWFTPFEEYDSFADEEDLVKKVRYYLGNEIERTTLANRGWLKATTAYHPRKFWQSVFQTLGVFTGDFPC